MGGIEQDLTQFAVIVLCVESTGCDEMGDYFATAANTMIDIVCEVDLNKIARRWVRPQTL